MGIFDPTGSGFDSEIWGDINQVMDAFKRGSFSTVTFRLEEPNDFAGLADRFRGGQSIAVFVPKRERKFFEEQSEMMAKFIRILGVFITVIFSTGATIGAMITMYGAVANRTLKSAHCGPSAFIAAVSCSRSSGDLSSSPLAGGILGLGLASLLQFFTISTLNFGSFSELAFSFALSPSIVVTTLTFSVHDGTGGWIFTGGQSCEPGYHSGAAGGLAPRFKSSRNRSLCSLVSFELLNA